MFKVVLDKMHSVGVNRRKIGAVAAHLHAAGDSAGRAQARLLITEAAARTAKILFRRRLREAVAADAASDKGGRQAVEAIYAANVVAFINQLCSEVRGKGETATVSGFGESKGRGIEVEKAGKEERIEAGREEGVETEEANKEKGTEAGKQEAVEAEGASKEKRGGRRPSGDRAGQGKGVETGGQTQPGDIWRAMTQPMLLWFFSGDPVSRELASQISTQGAYQWVEPAWVVARLVAMVRVALWGNLFFSLLWVRYGMCISPSLCVYVCMCVCVCVCVLPLGEHRYHWTLSPRSL
jgi:hypothetical protein